MEEINWEEAPEGADAYATKPGAQAAYGPWRKFVGDVVFYHKGGMWYVRAGTTTNAWKRGNPHVLRPAPVEAELPNGLQWLEGADFYHLGTNAFFRFDEPGYKYLMQVAWNNTNHAVVNDFAARPGTIFRFPGAQPKAAVKKEEPVKKKRAVGWWN